MSLRGGFNYATMYENEKHIKTTISKFFNEFINFLIVFCYVFLKLFFIIVKVISLVINKIFDVIVDVVRFIGKTIFLVFTVVVMSVQYIYSKLNLNI